MSEAPLIFPASAASTLSTASTVTNTPAAAPTPAVFGARILTGLAGVLLAVVIAQLNDHVSAVAMPDIRGRMGLSRDAASWLDTLYQAAQVCAMMVAPWCSGTFSLRRFTMGAVAVFALLGVVMPFAPGLPALYVLRTAQGFAGGCLPPMLMTVALRFLPPGIKLYGLGAYALTATFAPNLGAPLAALWSEYVGWRWLFWQIVPLAGACIAMIGWGLPQDPLRLARLRTFNWRGVLLGLPAITMLVIVCEQGTRLGGFDSSLIRALTGVGAVLLVAFFVNEWHHPLPFFHLALLARRNLAHSLVTLGGVLVVLVAVPGVPAGWLAQAHGYRPLELAPLALSVALPQLVALPLVAALCNLRRVDCRWVLAAGLAMIAASCAAGANLTSQWVRENFYIVQWLQIFAQPMAVIPLLLLATNGMTPQDGPFASAWFNTVKGFAVVVGSGVTEGLLSCRERFHLNVLVDQSGNRPIVGDFLAQAPPGFDPQAALALFAERVHEQALVLASADVLRVMAGLSLALILLIPMWPTRVYPPRPAA
ncbi:MAG: putative multidrug resistance protein EmrY [Burkholderia plantarii]|nr:MAG: putative multidrug resistance protein EmrY [Burkholderia plantarii]